MQTKHLCVLIHIWTKGEVGAPLNRFKPSSKIFLWLFQGGISFVDLLCFFLSCVCFVRVCLYVTCGHLLGKSWPLGSRLWCFTVSLLLSHWYPGSGVVLDCIDSWSLHPYLLWCYIVTIKYITVLVILPSRVPSQWKETKNCDQYAIIVKISAYVDKYLSHCLCDFKK